MISDTHVTEISTALSPKVKQVLTQIMRAFTGVDLILHAGDLQAIAILDWLEKIAPIFAARGNADTLLPVDIRLNRSKILVAEGWRIGLIHALPIPNQALWQTVETIIDDNFGSSVDIIIFGDSHQEIIRKCNGVLLINPGSPILPHHLLPQLGTVGILNIFVDKVEAIIISLASLTPIIKLELDTMKR